MPCKDTTAQVTVFLDMDERLTDFEFSKLTCHKEIGAGTGFKEYCLERSIDEIAGIEFSDILQELDVKESEDQFLLFLEWDALWTAIAQYRGWDHDIDRNRYQLSSIIYDEGKIQIRQVIHPPREMPKIIPCRVRQREGTLKPSG